MKRLFFLATIAIGLALLGWRGHHARHPAPVPHTPHPDDVDWSSAAEQEQFMCEIGYIQC